MFRSYRTAIACRRESNSCPSFCHLHNNYIVSIVVVMRGVRFSLSLQIGPKTIIFFLVEFVVGSVLSNAIIHMLLCHAYWIEANLCYSRPFASQRNWKWKGGEGGVAGRYTPTAVKNDNDNNNDDNTNNANNEQPTATSTATMWLLAMVMAFDTRKIKCVYANNWK